MRSNPSVALIRPPKIYQQPRSITVEILSVIKICRQTSACCFTRRHSEKYQAPALKNLIAQNVPAPTKADAGMVSIQAMTMRRATPQRTADNRLVAPTPTIAPVMVWVVLTGIPASEAGNRVIAPAVSAQNPPTGLSFVIREPIV